MNALRDSARFAGSQCASRGEPQLAGVRRGVQRDRSKEPPMADLYLKALESERKALWATCRLKGLAKDTPERQRIAALDEAIAAHKARKAG